MSMMAPLWLEASSGDLADWYRLIEDVKDLCDTWEDDGTRPTYDVAPAALDGPRNIARRLDEAKIDSRAYVTERPT